MKHQLTFTREYKKKNTIIKIGNVKIGEPYYAVAAGPCAIETEEQYFETAQAVKDAGADIIRGSIFKPRTSPYSFQGLGRSGLRLLDDIRTDLDMVVETEVMDPRDVKITADHVDILRIGARNMQNFDLLKEVAKLEDKPIILKNGIAATLKEWLYAAEYLMSRGNKNIILCMRGVRTYDTTNRNTLDLSLIRVLKQKTHLPIIVDPSHATGKRELILPVSKAAIASGADGLLIEVHCCPEDALCDGKQSLTPELFQALMDSIQPYLSIERRVVSKTKLDINAMRWQISSIDTQIIDLLAKRMSFNPALVEYKKKKGLSIFQPQRENQIYQKYWKLARERGINPELIRKLYELIIEEMKIQQKELM